MHSIQLTASGVKNRPNIAFNSLNSVIKIKQFENTKLQQFWEERSA